MSFRHALKRSERIKMFLHEYYFGQSSIVTLMRIIGGPVLILMGIDFYQRNDKFAVAYGGFMFFYGIYYILKPLFWILLRLDSFKTVNLNIEILEDRLSIKNTTSESEILFEGINKICRRKFYYALEITKFNKIYLPFSILTEEQINYLSQNSKMKNTG